MFLQFHYARSTSFIPQLLILNTKQDYQHFHQPTSLATLLHTNRNAPFQPIPIPFLLLLSNSFLSINTTLLHPLYNKHSPHLPFTSTTIQRQLLAIARNRASLPLITSRIPPQLRYNPKSTRSIRLIESL